MRRICQATSLVLLGLALFLVFQGHAIGLTGHFGPGPGFFAFWVGIALAVLSIAWCGQVSRQPAKALPPDFIPERGGMLRVVSLVFAMVAFAIVLTPLGFNLAMFGLLVFLLLAYGREYPILKIVIAIAGSFGIHYIFESLLKVPLPYASIAVLRNMGL